MICFLLSIGSFAKSPNGDYKALWSELSKFESEGLYKSAYEIADNIYSKAKDDGRDDQLIKAIIFKAKLARKFEDQDPASVILKFENELHQLNSESGKSIFHTMLGELYHRYALSNLHRFSGRTPEVQDSLFLAYGSLQAIQNASISHFQKSVDIITDKGLDDFQLLFNDIDSTELLDIKAESLEEFILYRSLQHFTSSIAFVSIPKGRYVFNNENLFASDDIFVSVDVGFNTKEDFRLIALELFQRLANNKKLNIEKRRAIASKRIDFVYGQFESSAKDELYLDAQKRITELNGDSKSIELAFIKLIDYYLNNAESRRAIERKDNYYMEAFRWIQKYKARFKNPILGKTVDQQRQRLNSFSLDIEMEKVIPSGIDFLAFAKYRNVPKLHFKLYKLNESEYTSFLYAGRQDEKLTIIDGKEEFRIWSIDLPAYSDFNSHSLEFPVESLDFGYYILASSSNSLLKVDDSQPMIINAFQVSNLSYSVENILNGIVGRVLDRNTGKTIEGAKIDVYEHKYNARNYKSEWQKIDELRADNFGVFKYNSNQNNFSFKISKENDYLDLRERHYQYSVAQNRRYISAQLFTDRSIYRPGQIIHFKGLVYSQEQSARIPRLETGTELKLLFRDVNYQIVNEYNLTSNEYGSFEGRFKIPNTGLNGSYTIEITIPGNSYHHNVQVEEYRRPKIKAKFDKITKSYILGDTITITGLVNTYTGLNLEGVSVDYRIVKSEFIYPYFNRGISPYYSQEEIIAYGNSISDKDGKFSFDFPTELNSNSSRSFYQIECEITDLTGESLTINKDINLSEEYFSIDLKLPEFSFEKQLDSVKLSGSNLEGELLELDYNISVFEIKDGTKFSREKYWGMPDQFILSVQEYSNRFPWDKRSKIEDSNNLKPGKKCMEFQVKGKLLNIYKFNSLRRGAYKIVVEAKDNAGNIKQEERTLYISNLNKLALTEKALWLPTVRSKYEVGEDLKVELNTPFKNAIIYYQISHNNKMIKSGELEGKNKKLQFIIEEKHRGGLYLSFYMVHHNRAYQEQYTVNVPWSNRNLDIYVKNFRDKTMPGTDEEIELVVTQKGQALTDVELTASMYDASLDIIIPHRWQDKFFPNYNNSYRPLVFGYGRSLKYNFGRGAGISYETNYRAYTPTLRWYGFQQITFVGYKSMMDGGTVMKSASRLNNEAEGNPQLQNFEEVPEEETILGDQSQNLNTKQSNLNIAIRENLSELVLFYPQLKPDKDGAFKISYKMNDALTKWKLMLFAHDKSFSTSYYETFVTTYKPIMVQPFLPRFVIQGDQIVMTARITNTTDKHQVVDTRLTVQDSKTKETITDKFLLLGTNAIEQTLAGGESVVLSWTLDILESQINPLDITITSITDEFSDGEISRLPVLSKRIFLTESLPLFSNSNEQREFYFKALDKLNEDNSIESFQYVLNYQSDPSWIILKSLPFLLNDKPKATTQIFDALYATIVGREIIGKSPNLRAKLEEWSQEVSKDFELNSLLNSDNIEQTPWLRDGLEEKERMKNLVFLLDDNQVDYRINEWINLLKERQLSNGGLSWMSGGRDNWYISQYVLEGIARMKLMDLSDQTVYKDDFVRNLITYIDKEFIDYYSKHKIEDQGINAMVAHYLFVRSYFDLFPKGEELQVAIDHYMSSYKNNWLKGNTYLQSLLGIIYVKSGDMSIANAIKSSLLERLIRDEEVGFYLNDQAGYYWYQLDVEKQSTLIEFFKLVQSEKSTIDGLKLWLLKNRQLNSWKTSKATAAAIYSFYDLDNPIGNKKGELIIRLPNANEYIVLKNDSHVKRVWISKDSMAKMNIIQVDNQTTNSSWGSVSWQFFQDLDEVDSFKEAGLKINKEIFKLDFDDAGESMKVLKDTKLKKGDRLRVKMEIYADRPMEFIQLKDMRGSGTEALNIISRHHWQDGLSYYENTKDDASYFFIEYLPKGRFVFEYDIVVSHAGNFSGGIASINSMYAPEFISHSKAQKLKVEN